MREQIRCSIRLEPDGFSRWQQRRGWICWRGPQCLFQIRYDQIDRIIAYKDDLYIHDCICLGFYVDGQTERYLFVDEQMDGWSELIDQLDERFQIGHQWYMDIMTPAFERCERTLWSRQPTGE